MTYSESDLNGQACFLNDKDEQMSTPKYYQIIAMITTHSRKGAIVKQIPTFYLSSEGITNTKHAIKIAKEIISPRASDLRVVDVTVVEVY
jgi:hypothetical protein